MAWYKWKFWRFALHASPDQKWHGFNSNMWWDKHGEWHPLTARLYVLTRRKDPNADLETGYLIDEALKNLED